MKVCAVLLAAGRSERFGADKLWADFEGEPLWLRSFRVLSTCPMVDAVVVVCQPGRVAEFRQLAPSELFVVEGGSTRQASVRAGVLAASDEFEIILVHDAARAFVEHDVVQRVIEATVRSGAAFPCVPVTDTVRLIEEGGLKTLDRAKLVAAQTPQGARRADLVLALNVSTSDHTDEVSLLESVGITAEPVKGETDNIKVTNPSDLPMTTPEIRTGFGYDVHRFSDDPDRPCWIGGVEFADRPGLEGHSDADVLIHAIVDALLGAASLGDIGTHYPNTEGQWKNAPSSLFLRETAALLARKGWRIVNIDATVIAERPRIMPRRDEICAALARLTGVSLNRISVKATTNEGLGSIGRAEGVAAHAVAVLSRSKS